MDFKSIIESQDIVSIYSFQANRNFFSKIEVSKMSIIFYSFFGWENITFDSSVTLFMNMFVEFFWIRFVYKTL